MSRLISIRPAYCLFVTSLFVLGGCQATQNNLFSSGPDVTSAQASEPAAGDVVITNGNESLSPIEQHMLARKDVDPKKVNRKNKFSKTVDDYKRIEEERERELDNQLNAEPQKVAESQSRDLKIEADPIQNQQSAKSYVEAILERHKARQESVGIVENDIVQNDVVENIPVEDTKIAVVHDAASSNVKDVRIGQHPGKTRIVMDVSDKTKFQARFVDNGKTLLVNIPSASWAAQKEANVSGESLVKGYSTDESGSGVVMKIALNAPGKLAYQKAFKPSNGRGHRIVLDVVAR